MRQTLSSHLGSVDYAEKNYKRSAYNDDLKILLVHFHTNNSIYAYKNVPRRVYDELLNAPSQGEYFWLNIRRNKNAYPYIKLCESSMIKSNHFYDAFKIFEQQKQKQERENVLNDIYPELKKLDKLDEKESRLRRQHDQGLIDSEIYEKAREKLEKEREKLTEKLDKEGYFNENGDQEFAHIPKGDGYTFWDNVKFYVPRVLLIAVIALSFLWFILAYVLPLILPQIGLLAAAIVALCFIGLGQLFL